MGYNSPRVQPVGRVAAQTQRGRRSGRYVAVQLGGRMRQQGSFTVLDIRHTRLTL
jgi:hypothetical protein